MTTSTLLRCVFLLLLLVTQPLHAAIEWSKKEISLDVRRGSREDVPAKFEFRNTGSKPVTITGVATSCGCTVANPEKSTIAAGESSAIWALFTISQRTGQQEKTITVTTDDPDSPSVALTLKVNLIEPASASAGGTGK
jgi:hypothetical protein